MIIKTDLHTHCNRDPIDKWVNFPLGDLVAAANKQGIKALAVTCHEKQAVTDQDIAWARETFDITLMRGMECTVDNKHILLINWHIFPPGNCTWGYFRMYQKMPENKNGLTILPHAYYPFAHAGGKEFKSLHENLKCFDAIEWSGVYSRGTRRFNAKVLNWKLPVVGNSDTHLLWQQNGKTYTEVTTYDVSADGICKAIKRGHVSLKARPLSIWQCIRFLFEPFWLKYK